MDETALFKLTHGLYVLGAKDEKGRLVGSIVDAVMQVANKPLVIALSCLNSSYTKECILKNQEFSLSILGKNVDPFVIANFGYQTGRIVDKWDNVDFHLNDDLPYLQNNLAEIKCRVIETRVFESNTLFISEVVSCINNKDEDPLTYYDYRSYFKKDVLEAFQQFNKKGKTMAEDNDGKKWVCTVCGYVYDEATPFEELPDDWVCPLCGVGKDMFEQQ